jgi:hypothetical protein
MGALQNAGIVSYSRGKVRILRREALEAAACECYLLGREAYGRARLTMA